MKSTLFIFLVILILASCKKGIIVDENKAYSEVGPPVVYDDKNKLEGLTGMFVELKPSGDASFALGGDAIYPATYSISGKTLKVYWDEETYKFKIISEEEIQYKNKTLKQYRY